MYANRVKDCVPCSIEKYNTGPRIAPVFVGELLGSVHTVVLKIWSSESEARVLRTEILRRRNCSKGELQRSAGGRFQGFSLEPLCGILYCGTTEIKLHPLMPTSHVGTGSGPGWSTCYATFCWYAYESSGRCPKCLNLCTHVGDLNKASGSWLWPGPNAVAVAIWRSEPIAVRFLVLSLPPL